MELIDALKVIEDQLRPGVMIELWMTDSGQIVRKAGARSAYADFIIRETIAEMATAIKAVKATSPAILIKDFKGKFPDTTTLHDELVVLNEELAIDAVKLIV